MAPLMMLLAPRLQLRGRDSGMAGSQDTVELEKVRKMTQWFCERARLSSPAWLNALKGERMLRKGEDAPARRTLGSIDGQKTMGAGFPL